MLHRAALLVVLAAPLTAAPKLRTAYPDVVVGREFLLPWPPVEISPPSYVLRIEGFGPDGVDVRQTNGYGHDRRLMIDPATGNAFVGDYAVSDCPLPTVADVQRLIDLRHR